MDKHWTEDWALEHHHERYGWVYLGTEPFRNNEEYIGDFYVHPEKKLLSIVDGSTPGSYISPDWEFLTTNGDIQVYDTKEIKPVWEGMPHYEQLADMLREQGYLTTECGKLTKTYIEG